MMNGYLRVVSLCAEVCALDRSDLALPTPGVRLLHPGDLQHRVQYLNFVSKVYITRDLKG